MREQLFFRFEPPGTLCLSTSGNNGNPKYTHGGCCPHVLRKYPKVQMFALESTGMNCEVYMAAEFAIVHSGHPFLFGTSGFFPLV